MQPIKYEFDYDRIILTEVFCGDNGWLFAEICYTLCAFARPVPIGRNFVDEDKCRYCKTKTTINLFDTSHIYWRHLTDCLDDGKLLSLCDNCVNNATVGTPHIPRAFVSGDDVYFEFRNYIPAQCPIKFSESMSKYFCGQCARIIDYHPNDTSKRCICAAEREKIMARITTAKIFIAEICNHNDIAAYMFDIYRRIA